MISLGTRENEFGLIEILQYQANGLLLYMQGGHFQSETDGNGISLAPYIHSIYGLLTQAKARNVLMIGCGGGSLGTMLTKAAVNVTIVDKNPAAFELAREYFHLPRAVACHIADGKEFLLRTKDRYDAIVLDAFDGDQIPPHLQTAKFFQLVDSRLHRTHGCLFSNLHALHDLDKGPDQYAATARRAWNNVRLLDTQGVVRRNALLIAGDVASLQKPTILMPPSICREEIALDLSQMMFRPWRFQ